MKAIQTQTTCFHCGDLCDNETVEFQEKTFCCHGCKSVFELLQSCDLGDYYQYAETPGIKKLKAPRNESFAYLDNDAIAEKLVSFSSETLVKVKFRLPAMHCASCIWLIENFRKLVPGVIESRVNFVKLEAAFSYNPQELTLRQLVEQLASIGYEPELNLKDTSKKKTKTSKTLIYQIGVAGFCFGNIMLLSFPEYLSGKQSVSSNYRLFFGIMNFTLVLPVLFFSARDYILSALRVAKRRQINMDVPITLGILALFVRSTYEIFIEGGGGYMDSLSALIFFLLIGKWIQQRTYQNLSFERDYRSYFPIAVQKFSAEEEESIPIEKLQVNDQFIIRSGELIPTDAELISGQAEIDYSFVTGESDPVRVEQGKKLYAGGRQRGPRLVLKALKPVDQSYLTSLWNKDDQSIENDLETLADKVGKKFTWAVVGIALLAGIYWAIVDQSVMLNAVSAVLIVACPCALALSFPFAFGNAIRLMGRKGFYLKNTHALTRMADIDQIVFDKTGTLTRKGNTNIKWLGDELNDLDLQAIIALTKESAHPLSRHIHGEISENNRSEEARVSEFKEHPGKGIWARYSSCIVKLGSAQFMNLESPDSEELSSKVFYSFNGTVKGFFLVDKNYHDGLSELISDLKKKFRLFLISGDSDGERRRMESLFGQKSGIYFKKLPHEKAEIVKKLKQSGKTAMIGDGLNDAAALKASDFGISVADDIFRFTPASDAILSSENFSALNKLFDYSKASLRIVKWSFVFSFLYNGVGLFFAVQGLLTPVIAAILMPLSSVTVVLFVSLGTHFQFNKLFKTSDLAKTDKNQVLK